MSLSLHSLLDFNYGAEGAALLKKRLEEGEDLSTTEGPFQETPLHVASRRRRSEACAILLDHGASAEAKTSGGKTAYVHAARRGFSDVCDVFAERGLTSNLTRADELAVLLCANRTDEARSLIARHPEIVRTGNPEEDRLLADLAGRFGTERIALLIEAGANLAAPALDDGTPLHQAAWFGQPENARLLIAAGAPLEQFDKVHESSPLGWAVHGSRFSGGAEERQDIYVELVTLLLEAGASMQYPDDPDGSSYRERLLQDATPAIRAILSAQ